MPAKRRRGAEPPWLQAAPNTNQPTFIRPSGQRWLRSARQWCRRGKAFEPPWFQAAANTNQPYIILQGRHAVRLYGRTTNRNNGVDIAQWATQVSAAYNARRAFTHRSVVTRRGNFWDPPYSQAVVNPNFVFSAGSNTTKHLRPFVTRRGQTWDVPWYQAAANTNQPPFIYGPGQHHTKIVFTSAKRAHFVQPPWGQAAANTNQPYFVAPSGQRRRAIVYMRRGHVWLPVPDQLAFIPNVPSVPVQNRLAFTQKVLRIRRVWPTPAQAAANTNQPYFVFPSGQTQRRTYRYWQRRGNFVEPGWGQSTFLPNPNYVFRQGQRRVQQAEAFAKRPRIWLPTPPQAAANTNQPYYTFAQGQRRVRPPYAKRARIAMPTQYAGAALLAPFVQRRIRAPYAKRGHIYVPVQSQDALVLPRALTHQRRSPAYAKRGKLWLPTQQQAAQPNPTFIHRPPAPHRIYWPSRRTRGSTRFPLPQAPAPPNPGFTEHKRRRALQRFWYPKPRGHAMEPGWGQAIAPPVTGFPAIYLLGDELVVTYYAEDELTSVYYLTDEDL